MVEKDIWNPLGEQKWRELAEGTGASELQLKFAAARFSGASASGAARLAGYSAGGEGGEGIRRAGYSALRSTQVQNLLELASVASPKEGRITDAEIDAKISRLIRSGDPQVVLKAASLHDERERRKKEAGESPTDDGFEDWRTCRDYLEFPNGASAFAMMYRAVKRDLGWPGNWPMLHDVYHLLLQEPMGKQIFDFCCANCSEDSRKDLDRKLANKDYQLKARIVIWREIGKSPPAGALVALEGGANAA